MLSDHVNSFINDEDGGYVVLGLFWFVLLVSIGGLAVDITDAYRTQTSLQATADAAALAAVTENLNDENAVDTQAITYASLNMAPSLHGNVLTTTDVQVGTWNFNSRTFSPRGSNPNAVYAVTRRSTENSNPLATNFLRIAGLQSWDVIAEAVAEAGIDECLYNGIVAGGDFFLRPHITYTNLICLIGHEQFHFISNDTTFDPGVYVGAGCNESDKKCIGPGTNPEKDNTGFPMTFNLPEGNYNDPTLPSNAAYVGDFIDAARAMAKDN